MKIKLFILLLFGLVLSGCGGDQTPVYAARFEAFNATVDVHLLGLSRDTAILRAREIEQDFVFLDRTFYVPHSGALDRLNEHLAAGELVVAPPALWPLLARSQVLAERSDDLFNPALGLLYKAWDLNDPVPCQAPSPQTATLERIVATEPKLNQLYRQDLTLGSDNPAVRLDFRHGAKGYALDLAIQHLRDQGLRHAMVRIGSNVRVIGHRAGRPWRIPVVRASGSGVFGMLNLSGDASVFTASIHHDGCLRDGRPLHSLLDPRTGRPANDFIAVTVVHEGDALTAEAGAVALFVAGADDWEALAKQLGLNKVLLFDRQGGVYMTPELTAQLERVAEPGAAVP